MKFMILFGQKLNETAFQIQKKKGFEWDLLQFRWKNKDWFRLHAKDELRSGVNKVSHNVMEEKEVKKYYFKST